MGLFGRRRKTLNEQLTEQGGRPPASTSAARELPPAEAMPTVMSLVGQGLTIHAIKEYRGLTGAGLKDSKEQVEAAIRRTGR